MSKIEEEFFIGWQGKAPENTGRFLRGKVIFWLVSAAILAVVLSGLQRTVGKGRWDFFGDPQSFSGLLLKAPVPLLISDKPDQTSGQRFYVLVDPLKFGFDPEVAAGNHLKRVSLNGTLLHNQGKAMIEVVPGSVEARDDPAAGAGPVVDARSSFIAVGEIVDGKCYLGAMNPGVLKTHRACAIHCIRGGIPPYFLVREGPQTGLYLMVGPKGETLNDFVLDRVAEPVRVRGALVDYGEFRILEVEPDAIERLGEYPLMPSPSL